MNRIAPRVSLRNLFLTALAAGVIGNPASAAPSGYVEVFHDPFSGTGPLDTNTWEFQHLGPRLDGVVVEDAVHRANGSLWIETYTDQATGEHHTGLIRTKEQFTYGYFEARIRFATVPAMWSGFWLYTPSIYQQGGGAVDPENEGVEVDIVEHRKWNAKPLDNPNGDVNDQIHNALHWNGYGAAHQKAANDEDDALTIEADGATAWHTFAVEWLPDRYVFYLDGQPYWDTLIDDPEPPYDASPYSDPAGVVSGVPQHVQLSNEVIDGGWAGSLAPGADFGPKGSATNGVMQVNWVRVFQKPASIDTVAALSWSDSNSAASSVTGDTLTIQTAKNSTVSAPLPTTLAIPQTGQAVTVSFDIAFDHVPTDAASSFAVGFGDSTSGGGAGDYFYEVKLNPLAATNGVVFAEGGDPNLGKVDSLGFGTSTHTLTFTITNTGTAEDMTLTLTSDLIAGGSATFGLDVLPATTTTLDTIYFKFNGDAWNELFAPGNLPITATITNFSIATNPEPTSLGLMGLGALSLLRRRR